SLAGLYRGLESLGLNPQGRHLEYADLPSLAYPTILSMDMKWGPHFMIYGGINGDTITLIDPPDKHKMSRSQFLQQWNGASLIVLPPHSKEIIQNEDNSLLYCDNSSQDLGEFTLPLLKNIETKFMVKNIHNKTVEIDKLIASCGCTKTEISKKKLLPNEQAEIFCSVSESGVSGAQKYTITVHVLGEETTKPLQLEFRANLVPLISIMPARLYYGRVNWKDLPVSRDVQVLKATGKVWPEITSVKTLKEWVKAKVKNNKIEVN
ncbi:MAG: DUF1573 domain-containing protein, partial [Planctomycetota bacterium]|nr:DUF1573 domain-containing protein [Planctomycetota bacterium]